MKEDEFQPLRIYLLYTHHANNYFQIQSVLRQSITLFNK